MSLWWYLSETNVGLAFLDEQISYAAKNDTFQDNQHAKKKELNPLEGTYLVCVGKDVSHSVTQKSKTFLGRR